MAWKKDRERTAGHGGLPAHQETWTTRKKESEERSKMPRQNFQTEGCTIEIYGEDQLAVLQGEFQDGSHFLDGLLRVTISAPQPNSCLTPNLNYDTHIRLP